MTSEREKVWGVTRMIYAAPGFEVHRIVVKPGGYCSKHVHAAKANTFWVERGRLTVERAGLPPAHIGACERVDVPAGLAHRFVNKGGCECVAYEIYAVDVSNDIHRFSEGGVHK